MYKVLLKVEIPDYIRTVQLSESQRPDYFYYYKDKGTIKARKKKLLKKYINKNFYNEIANNEGKALPHQLKFPYVIAGIQANKIVSLYGRKAWVNLVHSLSPLEHIISKTSLGVELFEYKKDSYSLTTVNLTEKQKQKPIKYILINYLTKEPVIANTTQVGRPREERINSQKIYSGVYNEFTRAKIIEAVKLEISNDIIKSIRKLLHPTHNHLPGKNYSLKQETFPIAIKLDLYDTIKDKLDNSKTELGRRWDLDNRSYIYMKCFIDELVSNKIIPDDDRTIVQAISTRFIPIKEEEQSKLVFTIIKL